MAHRNLRPADGWLARFQATPRPYHFDDEDVGDWTIWHKLFRAELLHWLGQQPERVPLSPEVTAEVDCGSYVRRHVLYDSEPYSTVAAWLLLPKSATAANPAAGVLCCHGHGQHGKNALVGVDAEGHPAEDWRYGLLANRLAEAGYVVLAPDWRGFGERSDTTQWVRATRDKCNVHDLAARYFGFTGLGLQIHDGRRSVDYLSSLPEVDAERLGVTGLSFGGTMTTYLAALDERLKCAVICCYLSGLEDALTRANFCGSQCMPGLGRMADIADVAGLIAPRPALVEMGESDACFLIDDAQAAYDHLQKIYTAAGSPDRLALDRFDGEHEVHGTVLFDWLARWLAPGVDGG